MSGGLAIGGRLGALGDGDTALMKLAGLTAFAAAPAAFGSWPGADSAASERRWCGRIWA